MVAQSDILLENYKVGTLKRYNLAYEQLKDEFPGLIYCSVTGFGQTGPYAPRAGYDFLVQAMGGIMSITGEPEGDPQKLGVGIADLMTGMYGLVAVLAALRHRDQTGKGQHIDMALLDTQVAWLSYAGQYFLTSGQQTPRMGNAHPTIVPYEAFPAADGYVILGVGNDGQYARFCEFAGRPELATDPRFVTNEARVNNRRELIPILREIISQQPRDHWLTGLATLGVPCSPINRVDQVFDDPQVKARGMEIEMPHPLGARADPPDRQPDEVFRNAGRLPLCAADTGPAHRRSAEGVAWAGCGYHREVAERRYRLSRMRPHMGGEQQPPRRETPMSPYQARATGRRRQSSLVFRPWPFPALAHHGWGSYDSTTMTTLEGTVQSVSFSNPHASIPA